MAAGFGWKWNQDGTLETDPAGPIKPENIIGEVLRQADALASIVRSCDPDGQGGRLIGEQKRALQTALHKLAGLGGIATLPLYTETQREEAETGIVLTTLEPRFDQDELARGLIALCMTPFGQYGHADLLAAVRITPEQIDRLERNRTLVADLAQVLPAMPTGEEEPPKDGQQDRPDSEEQTPQEPALTRSEQSVLVVLARFDNAQLASTAMIAQDSDAPGSDKTIKNAVKRLIKLNLAERPEGEMRGARLTREGRRLAQRLAP